jgi:TolB-like protein
LLYRFADFVLDTDRRELRRGPQLVAIAPQVFDLLEYLIKDRHRVVSKDELIDAIWEGRTISETALSTRINVVRSSIDDTGGDQRFIRTLPRKGVRFVGIMHESQEPAPPIAVGTTEQPTSALTLPDRPSIAVLPFTNIGGDPEQGYFADGMVEEIITALSRFSGLLVIARNSSFAYKGRSVDLKQVGRELGVRYVLEGSVRKAANRLRITGQLIDASDGVNIWADRFEGALENVFDLQDEVTASVVGAMSPKIEQAEIQRAKRKPTGSLDAYDYCLHGMATDHDWIREANNNEALRLFYKAIESMVPLRRPEDRGQRKACETDRDVLDPRHGPTSVGGTSRRDPGRDGTNLTFCLETQPDQDGVNDLGQHHHDRRRKSHEGCRPGCALRPSGRRISQGRCGVQQS